MYTLKQIERIKAELTPIDVEQSYRDFLDEIYDTVSIAGLTYSVSHALETIDPIAFRCGAADYVDAENFCEVDGQMYHPCDVESLLEQIEEEEEV